MTATDTTEATTAPERPPIFAAAFGYWPDRASRIGGLGGKVPGDDPAYIFHTHYIDLPPGTTRCVLDFTGLLATRGTMVVRVNSFGTGEDARAESVRNWSLRLSDVAAQGQAELVFDAQGGKTYAVMGHVYDMTDATAAALDIRFEDAPSSSFYEEELAAAKKSKFGQRVFRRAATLLDGGRATLTDPVSQTCTSSQFDEPAYGQWLERLKLPMHRHRKQWEFIYILQVLERYGMLQPGARGIGFGVGVEPLPAAMAAMGCKVVATDLAADDERSRDWSLTNQHATGKEQLRNAAICPDELFDANVEFRAADMNQIPADLVDFDFTWSSCSYEHLGSIRKGLDFVANSVRCLRPGGLAVHTTEFNLTSNDETIDNEGTVLFRRRDFERLAIDLVSRGHFVAQIKYDFGHTQADDYVDVPPYRDDNHLKLALGRYVSTSFGIVVRRGER